MKIYTLAMEEIEKRVNSINDDYKDIFKEELINHVISRIKTSDSIIKKMKRKKY